MKNILLLFLLVVFLLSRSSSSFANSTAQQAFEYGMARIKGRIDYFHSLKDFMNNSENTIDEKLDLLETLSSGERIVEIINTIRSGTLPLQDSQKKELLDSLTESFFECLDSELIPNYEFFLDSMHLGLNSITDFPKAIELRDDLTQGLKSLEKTFPSLKWRNVDQRAKLIAVYKHLLACIGILKIKKIERNLKKEGYDIKTSLVEVDLMELPILEDLAQFLLELMPSEDREFVKLFKFSNSKKFLPNGKHPLLVDDLIAIQTTSEKSNSSFQNLESELKNLNLKLYQVHQRIQKQLRRKDFSSSLKEAPEVFDLDSPPSNSDTHTREQSEYFVNSYLNFMRELQYVESKVFLNEKSEQVLSKILRSLSEINLLIDRWSTLDLKNTLDEFVQIYLRLQEAYPFKQGQLIHSVSKIKKSWKITFMSSYSTNVLNMILYEKFKFNTKLLEKINPLIHDLQNFYQERLAGRRQVFKLKPNVEHDSEVYEEKVALAQVEAVEFESLGVSLSQVSVSKEELVEIGSDKLNQVYDAEPKDVTLRQTEVKQQKLESSIDSATLPLFYSAQEPAEVFSRFSQESEQSEYTQIIQDNFKVRSKDYKLLERLFSSNPGGIPFEDLNRLIQNCGGIVEQARGSHIKITMPGKKFFSAYRPHRRGRTEKVRNFLVDIYRKALSDVKDRIM